MTNYERDFVRTIAKWLNEETEHIPRQEIAELIVAFRALDEKAQKYFEPQEMNDEESCW